MSGDDSGVDKLGQQPGNAATELPQGTYVDAPDWAQRVYEPTDEEQAYWKAAGYPPDDEVIGGILSGMKLVWGVPKKSEVIELVDIMAAEDQFSLNDWNGRSLSLRIAELSLMPTAYFTTHPPVGGHFSRIVEHNYLAHVQVVTVPMDLAHLRLIHDSNDESEAIVFEGTEYPGPVMDHRIRVVRVTVHDTRDLIDNEGSVYATYEVLAETVYPHSPF